MCLLIFLGIIRRQGGSRIFSCGGGGGDLQKIFKNFVDLFLGRPNSFSERSLIIKKTLLRSKKNGPKKAFLGTFWKNLT